MSKRLAQVVGPVAYRQGDGAQQKIPIGNCEVDTTDADATISWTEGETSGLAVLPYDEYVACLDDGSLVLL